MAGRDEDGSAFAGWHTSGISKKSKHEGTLNIFRYFETIRYSEETGSIFRFYKNE